MPSLLTSATTGRGISRVNSFSRDWGADEQARSSTPIEWSPSPPCVKHKLPFAAPAHSAASASTSKADDGLTPQERRRRAIFEALEPNAPMQSTSAPARSTTASVPSRSSGPPLRASSSTILQSSRLTLPPRVPKVAPLSAAAAEEQALPELPTLDIKKRPKPWEDDFS